MTDRISIEENAERVKIVIPLKRIWPFWWTYSLLLLVWIGSTIWGVSTLIGYAIGGDYGFTGLFLLAWIIILILIAALWFWLGSMVWKRWQYYTAGREILFFYPDKLIVRRPLSLMGVTDAYDRLYVSPLHFDDRIQAAVFDYGSYRIPVGSTLTPPEAGALVDLVNSRFYPDTLPEEDEED